jgi:hypothetical protein
MADITMCKGGECPFKEKCKRFTATANEYYQAYFIDVPYDNYKCDMYWGENQDGIYEQLKTITTIPPIEIKDDDDN